MSDALRTEATHTSGAVTRRPVTIVRGAGSTLYDDTGKAYIDCASGHGWASVGHSHPRVVDAIRQQAGRLICHTESSANDERAKWFTALTTTLGAAFPADDRGALSRIMPTNSGAEATEGAIKLARLTTGRKDIVAFHGGFHGRTLGALSATASPKYRDPFEPLVPGFRHAPFDDLAATDTLIGDDTAAVILEVIQGEGGVREASSSFFHGVERLCRKRGALLIVDEIQTGLGRTGRWFASEWHGLAPDVVLHGKTLGGGIPMGAVAWRETLGTFPAGTHGSTFGGNPLACAAGQAVLAVLAEEALPERADRVGTWLMRELRGMSARAVRDVRGRGLMIGVELKQRVGPLLRELMTRGVWALPAGPNVLRLLPPLTIDEASLGQAVSAIAESLAHV